MPVKMTPLETILPAVCKFLPAGVISSFSRVYSLTSFWVDVHGESKTNKKKSVGSISPCFEVGTLKLLLESSQLSDLGEKAYLSLVMFPEIARSF